MKCTQCNKEFEAKRADARFCSQSCQKKFSRTKTDVRDKEVVQDNWKEAKSGVRDNPPAIPITPITPINPTVELPPVQETHRANYYESEEYLALIKHLEDTPIEELKKEGIFIPAWKRAGFEKKPTPEEIIAVAGGMDMKWVK